MKKVFLHISAITLMIYMLISSMGLFVYEHHCLKAGTFYGVSSEFNHHCDDKKQQETTICKASEMSCCKKPSNEKRFNKNCCTTDVNWIQLDVDLSVNDIDVDFNKDLKIAFDSNFDFFRPRYSQKTEEIRGPPPKLKKPSQSILQCYLI